MVFFLKFFFAPIVILFVISGQVSAEVKFSQSQFQIMRETLRVDGTLDRDTYEQFWNEFPLGVKGQLQNDSEYKKVLAKHAILALKFQVELLRSASRSLAKGKLNKTENYDQALRDLQSVQLNHRFLEVMRTSALLNARTFLNAAADGQSIQVGGHQHYLDAKLLNNMLAGVGAATARVIQLLNPNWKEIDKRIRTEQIFQTEAQFEKSIGAIDFAISCSSMETKYDIFVLKSEGKFDSSQAEAIRIPRNSSVSYSVTSTSQKDWQVSIENLLNQSPNDPTKSDLRYRLDIEILRLSGGVLLVEKSLESESGLSIQISHAGLHHDINETTISFKDPAIIFGNMPGMRFVDVSGNPILPYWFNIDRMTGELTKGFANIRKATRVDVGSYQCERLPEELYTQIFESYYYKVADSANDRFVFREFKTYAEALRIESARKF